MCSSFSFSSSFSRPFCFLFFFHIFIHCHPLLSYGLNFKSLTHQKVKYFVFVFFIFLTSFSFFSLSFHIFIHCHPLLSYGPNFKFLAHREISLKSITKFHSDRYTRKGFNKKHGKKDRHVNNQAYAPFQNFYIMEGNYLYLHSGFVII